MSIDAFELQLPPDVFFFFLPLSGVSILKDVFVAEKDAG